VLNKVRWTLDNETDSDRFERLCIDLLYRTGYHDIVPVGGKKDRGRDAEMDRRRTPIFIAPSGERTFFQFSLADRWAAKLEDELAKVKRNGHDIDAYLFVTTGPVTGTKRDQLGAAVKEGYGWRLDMREREWLRLQLEEAHPDLAERHLGIPQAHEQAGPSTVDLPPLVARSAGAKLFNEGKYAHAAVALTDWLSTHADDARSWCALAACHYQQRHYADALGAIHEAAALQPHDLFVERTHASILVEKGIQEHERASILRGRDIFEHIARTSHTASDAYNLANARSALGDHAGARIGYQEAVERDPNRPEIWKNLGSAYERLENPDEALRCYERALTLDAALPEALFAKATILIKRGDRGSGAALLERVFATHAAARTHWSAAWWWLAEAYRLNDKPLDALRVLGRALGHFPSNVRLLDLKAHLLSEHWQLHADLQREAEAFFRFRAELAPTDYRPIESLARLYVGTDRVDAAWALVDDYLGDPTASLSLRELAPLDDERLKTLGYVRSYRKFREQHGIDEYVEGLRTNGAAITDEQGRRLSWAFLVAFAGGWRDADSITERDVTNFTSLSERHAPRIRAALAEWAESVSLDLLAPPQEQQIRAFTNLVLICPQIALLECSRQTGFLGGYFWFAIDGDTVPIPEAVTRIHSDAISDLVEALNRRTKLFPEKKATGK
jgi:tetratricopeptide (TPR) repeat protein